MTATTRSAGKHSAAGQKATRANAALIKQLKEDNAALIATNEDLVCELTRSLIRGMQEATARSEAETENAALKAANKNLADKVIRAGAEHARLRQAVINARPRITETVQRLDRPYVSHVQVPYPVPVQSAETTNEQTQQLPILDLPETDPWPDYNRLVSVSAA